MNKSTGSAPAPIGGGELDPEQSRLKPPEDDPVLKPAFEAT